MNLRKFFCILLVAAVGNKLHAQPQKVRKGVQIGLWNKRSKRGFPFLNFPF
jgi:hypothetical protein